MHQQLWGYKVEEKLYLGVRERKRLNTTALDRSTTGIVLSNVIALIHSLQPEVSYSVSGCSLCSSVWAVT
jgi:hypothetical protein